MSATPMPTIQEVTAAFEKVDLKTLEASTANLPVEAVRTDPGIVMARLKVKGK